jgi:hypothetical protein
LLDFCTAAIFYVSCGLKNQLCRCYIHLDNRPLNDHILIRVLLTPLKCIAKFLGEFAENPWEIKFEISRREKKGRRSEVFIELLGEVVIFLRLDENLWDILVFGL